MLARLELLIPPPLVGLAFGLAMWGLASAFPGLTLAFPFQGIIALALILTGAALDLVSILAFRQAGTTVTPLTPEKASSLVTDGLYSFTRNPMYLGLLAILSGIALLLGSPLNIALLIGFAAYITVFQVKPEEARLHAMFGEDFAAYTKRVRRWL